MRKNKKIIPSIMFHSIGLEDHDWVWSHISEPYAFFEKKLQLISKKYNTIFWADLYAYMKGEVDLPENSICLTFDDGYLDNWCYLYPLLKKYQIKATIFVNPDFVDPSQELRPFFGQEQLGKTFAGFLNWAEMREMEASGLVDIQSHALTHTWYFTSPDIVDIYSEESDYKYPWLNWNNNPDKKPFYLSEKVADILPLGTPIFSHQKSLVARRFYPDQSVLLDVTKYFQQQDIARLKKSDAWQELLADYLHQQHGLEAIPGVYESVDERWERIRHELRESKLVIENNLNKTVDFICWPGGGNDEAVCKMAIEEGYKAYTLGSQDQSNFRNLPFSDAQKIKRIGSIHRVVRNGKYLFDEGAVLLNLKIRAHQGSLLARLAYKIFVEYKHFMSKKG